MGSIGLFVWSFFFICVLFLSNTSAGTFSDYISAKQNGVQSPLLARHPREVSRRVRKKSVESFGTALYFNGAGQHLRLRPLTKEGRIELPRVELTVQFWVKPEGGQSTYTPIVDLQDECSSTRASGRWTVGITQHNYERKGARFVFSLQSDGAADRSQLLAHRKYDANVWTNVAVTYNGVQMNMYINGAKISLSDEQKGPIYGETSSKCKLLFIGGSELDNKFFRGELDELRIWSRALDHEEIVGSMYRMSRDLEDDDTRIISEPFAELSQWRVRPSLEPEIIKSGVPLPDHHLRFEAPPCGKTVCDDPSAVLSYVNNRQLRNEKFVKYRVINFMDDDGSNPLLSKQRISDQHILLNKAFAPYNITFILEQLDINNSSIRRSSVLIGCFPYMIGNGQCDPECQHSSLGNDGGDCDPILTECEDALLGNGRCDSVCNKGYHGYDDGDCCLPGPDVRSTCIDPRSPFRGYINIEDLKLELKIEGSQIVNIFLLTAPWYALQFRGLATYPWEKNVYTSMGGTVMHVDAFGHPNKLKNLVHEFGHSFGLWHVHRGVSDEISCDSECRETYPSMIRGDMCSDTNPTPRNRHCRDPFVDPNNMEDGTCGQYEFWDTPFNNYMSYADDSCIDHFTPQQVARMHCYIDLVYQPMREMKSPAPVPLAPKVVAADDTSVRIVWLEPLGTDSTCDSDNRLYQYADVATSSHSGVRWSPQEATGFPDAVHCLPSFNAWVPHYYGDEPGYCEPRTCWLELGFKTPVIPSRLTVWVVDLLAETELSVEMISTEGYSVFAGELPAYCDMEASLVVRTKKRIEKIRIYTSHKRVAIDAVQMVSLEDFPKCARRRPPKYRLSREPDFPGGYMLLGDPHFTDRDVKPGTTYKYSVQTVLESRTSVTSPSLTYEHGQPFCGDGLITEGEECDDRNSIDGDGCSLTCLLEEGFRCKGSPSLCYIHHGDGVCEPFEKGSNIQDCGVFTPDGFVDQWTFSAVANPKYQKPECPPSAVIGLPDLRQKCSAEPTGSKFWRPCRAYRDVTGSFWIQVTLYRPVVAVSVLVFLASDGITRANQEQKYIHVALVTEQDELVDLQPTAIPVRCRDNPVQVPVIQDISLPFFFTKGVRISFTSSSISIASVGVRSSNFINPPVIRSCRKSELYNPRAGTCVDQTCNTRTCGTFPVKYGEAVCTGDLEGDTCHIECDTGYFADGYMNKAICADGKWMTSSPLTCSPVDCGRLNIEHATVNCQDGTSFPNKCQFKCDRPARLTGTNTTVKCQSNGVWSELKARCDVRCDPLDESLFPGSVIKTPGCSGGPQPVGQQCKIRCGEGYHVDRENSKKRVLRLFCDDNGEWDGPDCVPNKCDPLPVIFTGAYTCTDEFYGGSTCTMNCPDNLNLFRTVTCQSEGEWDGALEICPSDATKTCDVMPQKDGVKFDCMDSEVGGKCSVTCTKRDHQAVYRGSRQIDDVINVGKLTCTVLQKWEPNPEFISCEPKCEGMEKGDGFCDAINNRDVCDWDGGDCCESTVIFGIVTPIPEDCTTECKCRDPAAPENKLRRRRHKFKKGRNKYIDFDE